METRRIISRRAFLWLSAMASAGLLLAACAQTPPGSPTAAPAASPAAAPTTASAPSNAAAPTGTAQSVQIANLAFSPPTLTVAKGQSITWMNADSTAHTVTSDDGKWDSGRVQPGSNFQHTFDQPGTYAYHCSIHASMKATVIVQG